MRLLALLLLALLALPAAAAPTLRAVFVGIDDYAFATSPAYPDAGFADLAGAVNDTRTIVATLSKALGRDFGALPTVGCTASTAAALILINKCATKAAITAGWTSMIKASQPEDVLILYFAGHGSRYSDDTTLDQASRYNSTIMAHDARDPNKPYGNGEIMDHEVRDIINTATSRGVRIVTIFDSCNSGTATRDGQSISRSAPPLRVTGLRRRVTLPNYGNRGAWRVHLAAAGDGQDATEAGEVGQRAGRFTTALARAITANPQASFADLAAASLIEVNRVTNGRQLPHAEGALRASFAGVERKVPTFDVVADGNRLLLLGGALLGVTPGSRFELFRATGDAVSGATAPLATARVVKVGNSVAEVAPEGVAVAGLPPRLIAREKEHRFGGPVLALAVEAAAARPLVAELDFVRADAAAPLLLRADAAGLVLQQRDGLVLARLPPAGHPDLPPRLAAALGKIARVQEWLKLLNRPADVCLAVSNAPSAGYDPSQCSGTLPPGGISLARDKAIRLGVVNRAPDPRQLYVFYIGPLYDVTVVLPAFGGRDPAVDSRDAIRDSLDIIPTEAGPARLVALSTSVSLDVSALEQTGTNIIDADACLNAVARAFCRSADASRSGTAGETDDWSAIIIPARIQP